MKVLSYISITNQCTQAPAWNFGVVDPGTVSLTDTGANVCRFLFQSSNNSAMLRIGQADGSGTAMDQDFSGSSWTIKRANTPNFEDIDAIDTSNAWGVADNSVFVKQGAASSWAIAGGVGCWYQAVSAAASNNVWAGGGNGCIRHWTGAWNSEVVPGFTAGADILSILAIDGTHVWVGTDEGNGTGKLWFYDGTWHDITPAGLTKVKTLDYARGNTNYVYAGTDTGQIWRSSTGGTTALSWILQPVSPSGTSPIVSLTVAPWATGFNTVWAISNGGANHIYRTTDGGATIGGAAGWSSVLTVTSGTLNDVTVARTAAALGTATLYAVGSRRAPQSKSTNGGTSWSTTEMSPALAGRINTVVALTATSAYEAGDGEGIIGTTDGTTWTRHTTPAFQASLFGLSSPTAATIFAVGGEGTSLRSTDSGSTWSDPCSPACPITDHLFGVSMYDTTSGWQVGDNARIRATNDAGVNWTTQAPPGGITGRLTSVAANSASSAWAAGMGAKVIHWNGSNWQDVSPPAVTDDLRAVASNDASTVFAAGDGGRVAYSGNGGATWITSVIAGGAPVFTSVVALRSSSTSALAFDTISEHVWKTTDGTVWNDLGAFNITNSGQAITTVDDQIIYEVGTYSKLARTTDGTAAGLSTIVTAGGPDDLYAVTAPSAHTVYSVGSGGGIVAKTSTNPVPDFNAVTNNFSNATNLFAVCLQAVNLATTVPDWTPDTFNTHEQCESTDVGPPGPWQPVPATMTKTVHTTTPGQVGQADFVFGFKASTSQAMGTYRATVIFEALAPNV